MNEIYRFRSVDKLLNEPYEELKKQTIYCASPESLNDPMEGYRNFYWQGDPIVWENLFRHYIYCLVIVCMDGLVFFNDIELTPEHIPIQTAWDDNLSDEMTLLIDSVVKKVFKNNELILFSKHLSNLNFKAKKHHLLFYLNCIHPSVINEISNEYNKIFSPHDINDLSNVKDTNGFLSPLMSVNYDNFDQEKFFENHYYFYFNMVLLSRIKFSSNKSSNIYDVNKQFIMLDFNKSYLSRLELITYPKWYTACFMEDYSNSSVWGNYGVNHTGVCLIFKTESKGDNEILTLTSLNGYSGNSSNVEELWAPTAKILHKIHYGKYAQELNFFNSIGWLPIGFLYKSWYLDKDNNMSIFAENHIESHKEEVWRENYWKQFYPSVLTKSKDWEYEKEVRIILTSMITDLTENYKRTLKYEFNLLKGIIFGINTKDSDKVKIIEIINKKCQENNRQDFKFYQAYFSIEDSCIHRKELKI